jgi:hypothetical protein
MSVATKASINIEPRAVADPSFASFMATGIATVLPAPATHNTLHASHNVVESCLALGLERRERRLGEDRRFSDADSADL